MLLLATLCHGVEEGPHAASASICSFYAFADAFKRRSIEVAPFERECIALFLFYR